MATADRDARGLTGTPVLVTGARGFLGAHLCPKLVAAGANVVAVSRGSQRADGDGIRWRQCDLEDFAQAATLVRDVRPQVIFHLGGKVTAAPDVALVLPTLHSLLTSSVNLLTLATEHGCRRVVFVASMEEPYGEAAEDVTPASPYSAAKWSASAYARMFHRTVRLPRRHRPPVHGLRARAGARQGHPVDHPVAPPARGAAAVQRAAAARLDLRGGRHRWPAARRDGARRGGSHHRPRLRDGPFRA